MRGESTRTLWSKTLERVDRDVFRAARAEFREVLASRRTPQDLAHDAELIFGELLANACEHGTLPIRIDLSEVNGRCILRVADGGSGVVRRECAAPPPDAIRGRGFNLIERLGGSVHIERPPISAVTVGLPL